MDFHKRGQCILYCVVVNADLFSAKRLLGEGLEVIYSSDITIKHKGHTSLGSGCQVTLFFCQISRYGQRDHRGSEWSENLSSFLGSFRCRFLPAGNYNG